MKPLFWITALQIALLAQAAGQISPSTPKSASVRILKGPELEITRGSLAIIRWSSNNPGGSPLHYGLVHYGTGPVALSRTARSPIRLNPGRPDAVFRVRIDGLEPRTTYYYTVESFEGNGRSDGVKSGLRTFTTGPPFQQSR
jgi:hypothetical protein